MNRKPQRLTAARLCAHIGLGIVICVMLILVVPLMGGNISLRTALSTAPARMHENPDALIFWGTRVPRVLLGLLIGGALALAGLVFQAVLRNPLAEPYILGISGGAALGKTIGAIVAVQLTATAFLLIPLFCFAGALLPLIALYILSTRTSRMSSVTILLGGVMMNVFFSSVIMLLQYFADFSQVRQMFLWMMGGLDIVGYRELVVVAPIVFAGVLIIFFHARAMNILSLGHSTAADLGVDVKRSVNALIWTGSVVTSTAVAVSGPIGFVGLLVPHSLRLLLGPDNRLLVPLSFLYGGVFLVLCDFTGWRGMELLQRVGVPFLQVTEIPVGVITSFLGGPFFFALLLKTSRRQSAE